jgi:hypothetical protein
MIDPGYKSIAGGLILAISIVVGGSVLDSGRNSPNIDRTEEAPIDSGNRELRVTEEEYNMERMNGQTDEEIGKYNLCVVNNGSEGKVKVVINIRDSNGWGSTSTKRHSI